MWRNNLPFLINTKIKWERGKAHSRLARLCYYSCYKKSSTNNYFWGKKSFLVKCSKYSILNLWILNNVLGNWQTDPRCKVPLYFVWHYFQNHFQVPFLFQHFMFGMFKIIQRWSYQCLNYRILVYIIKLSFRRFKKGGRPQTSVYKKGFYSEHSVLEKQVCKYGLRVLLMYLFPVR